MHIMTSSAAIHTIPQESGPLRARWLVERKKPDVDALLEILNEHGVEYAVTGSAAAMLHGVMLEPGDLDITPAPGHDNLARLAHVLDTIDARYEDAGFGPTPRDTACRRVNLLPHRFVLERVCVGELWRESE
jgi:hypothetical protein